eukprot:COSAG02_NODE_27816_length_602_cov_0.741551_1_plen_136_part_01
MIGISTVYPLVLLLSPAATARVAPASGTLLFAGDTGYILPLPDKSNSDACLECLKNPELNCDETNGYGQLRFPECDGRDWQFSLDRNDNAIAFSGWINSADPHRHDTPIFDFFEAASGGESWHIDLHFQGTSGRMC